MSEEKFDRIPLDEDWYSEILRARAQRTAKSPNDEKIKEIYQNHLWGNYQHGEIHRNTNRR